MSKLPIGFQKIKTKDYNKIEVVKYLVTISDKNSYFNKTALCDREELIKLRDELDKILIDSTTAEILRITKDKGDKLDNAFKSDILCKECEFKLTQNCVACLFELQSPLERKLFLELKKAKINFRHQYALNWYGQQISIADKSYYDPLNNFKEVLTVVDFFIDLRNVKLCIYTDGHSYHSLNQDQVKHDNVINRKLQELGFTVLRYNGKEINDDISVITSEVKKWTEKNYR